MIEFGKLTEGEEFIADGIGFQKRGEHGGVCTSRLGNWIESFDDNELVEVEENQ